MHIHIRELRGNIPISIGEVPLINTTRGKEEKPYKKGAPRSDEIISLFYPAGMVQVKEKCDQTDCSLEKYKV